MTDSVVIVTVMKTIMSKLAAVSDKALLGSSGPFTTTATGHKVHIIKFIRIILTNLAGHSFT